MLYDNGTRITVNHRGGEQFAGKTGTVVGGTLWFNSKHDPGDRTVILDGTTERIVFEQWMLDAAVETDDTDDATETATVTFDEYSVCTTCHLAAAGYDAHELGITDAEFSEALSLIPPTTHVVAGDEIGFSYSDCEGCGSTLGGDRFTLHVES